MKVVAAALNQEKALVRGNSCGTSFETLVDNNFVCSARLGVIVEPCPTSKSCIRHHKEGGGAENLSELSPNQV